MIFNFMIKDFKWVRACRFSFFFADVWYSFFLVDELTIYEKDLYKYILYLRDEYILYLRDGPTSKLM